QLGTLVHQGVVLVWAAGELAERREGMVGPALFCPWPDQVIVDVGTGRGPSGVGRQQDGDVRTLTPRPLHWLVEPAAQAEQAKVVIAGPVRVATAFLRPVQKAHECAAVLAPLLDRIVLILVIVVVMLNLVLLGTRHLVEERWWNQRKARLGHIENV